MKLALAFMTGVLSMAAVVYFAGAKLGGPMFLAGALAVVVPAIAALSSVKRVRSVARFLYSFAEAWEGKAAPASLKSMPDPSGYRKPSRKQQEQITRDSAAEYLGDDADELFGVSPSRRVG